MFCPKCGVKALDGAEFCHKCGAKVSYNNINRETLGSFVEIDRFQNSSTEQKPSQTNSPMNAYSHDEKQANNINAQMANTSAIMKKMPPEKHNAQTDNLHKRKYDKLPKILGIVLIGMVLSGIFNFATSDTSPSSVKSSEINIEESGDNNYGEFDNYVTSNIEIDDSLCGRWRSSDGRFIEFFNDGTASTDLILPPAVYNGNIEFITWSASNGQLILNSYFYGEYPYTVEPASGYIPEAFRIGEFKLNRIEGAEGDGMLGKWKDFWETTYAFYEDGTGIWNNMPSTWEVNDGYILVHFTYENSYDYYLTGDILELFFSNGSKSFIKIGS